MIETTGGYLPRDRAMTDMSAETWEDVGVNVLATRQRKNQTQTFKGCRWFDPTSTSREQNP